MYLHGVRRNAVLSTWRVQTCEMHYPRLVRDERILSVDVFPHAIHVVLAGDTHTNRQAHYVTMAAHHARLTRANLRYKLGQTKKRNRTHVNVHTHCKRVTQPCVAH